MNANTVTPSSSSIPPSPSHPQSSSSHSSSAARVSPRHHSSAPPLPSSSLIPPATPSSKNFHSTTTKSPPSTSPSPPPPAANNDPLSSDTPHEKKALVISPPSSTPSSNNPATPSLSSMRSTFENFLFQGTSSISQLFGSSAATAGSLPVITSPSLSSSPPSSSEDYLSRNSDPLLLPHHRIIRHGVLSIIKRDGAEIKARPRFFALSYSSLRYYYDEERFVAGDAEHGSILCNSVLHATDSGCRDNSEFRIVNGEKTIEVRAKSASEKKVWMTTLNTLWRGLSDPIKNAILAEREVRAVNDGSRLHPQSSDTIDSMLSPLSPNHDNSTRPSISESTNNTDPSTLSTSSSRPRSLSVTLSTSINKEKVERELLTLLKKSNSETGGSRTMITQPDIELVRRVIDLELKRITVALQNQGLNNYPPTAPPTVSQSNPPTNSNDSTTQEISLNTPSPNSSAASSPSTSSSLPASTPPLSSSTPLSLPPTALSLVPHLHRDFIRASMKRIQMSKRAQSWFGWSANEMALDHFSCGYEKNLMMLHGRMYVSENHVAFCSSVFNVLVNIPIANIIKVEKANQALVFPNALRLLCQDSSAYFFGSFAPKRRARAFNLVSSLASSSFDVSLLEFDPIEWRKTSAADLGGEESNKEKDDTENEETKNDVPTTSKETIKGEVQKEAEKKNNDALATESNKEEKAEKKEKVQEDQQTNEKKTDEKENASKSLPQDQSVDKSPEDASIKKMESSSIEAVPPSLDFSSYPLQPPIPNSPSKEGITMNTVIDQTFPLSRDAFFLLFFSDDALLSMRDYHLSRGDSEFLISSWRGVEGEGREVYQRELSLRVVVTDKSAFAPKSTRCLKIQRRMVDDDQAILINTTTVSLDVPWADCFFVQESWRIIDEPPLCRVHASYGWKFLSIPFSLKMAKGIAESRMHIDLKGSINDWAKLANNYISTHNDEIIYVNRAAKLKEKKLSTIRMKEIVQMPDTEFVGEAKKNNDNANLSNTNTTTPSSITSPPTLPSSDSSDVSLLPHLPHSPVIAAVMFFFLLMTLRFGSIDAFLMTIIIGLLSIIVVQNQRIDDRLQQTNRLLATQIGNSRSPPSSS